ncbi:MAG: hypothetical protein ACI3XY_07115 [Butyricicoccaceae bacterium]
MIHVCCACPTLAALRLAEQLICPQDAPCICLVEFAPRHFLRRTTRLVLVAVTCVG